MQSATANPISVRSFPQYFASRRRSSVSCDLAWEDQCISRWNSLCQVGRRRWFSSFEYFDQSWVRV